MKWGSKVKMVHMCQQAFGLYEDSSQKYVHMFQSRNPRLQHTHPPIIALHMLISEHEYSILKESVH